MRKWWFRLGCKLFGHLGLVRQWEWRKSTNMWSQRPIWTCVRCQHDIENPPVGVQLYAMMRPDTSQLNIPPSIDVIRVRVIGLDFLYPIDYTQDIYYESQENKNKSSVSDTV